MSRLTVGRVEGRACVVTGAGSGIGRAIAVRLAEEGGRVLCADVNGGAAEETAGSIGRERTRWPPTCPTRHRWTR